MPIRYVAIDTVVGDALEWRWYLYWWVSLPAYRYWTVTWRRPVSLLSSWRSCVSGNCVMATRVLYVSTGSQRQPLPRNSTAPRLQRFYHPLSYHAENQGCPTGFWKEGIRHPQLQLRPPLRRHPHHRGFLLSVPQHLNRRRHPNLSSPTRTHNPSRWCLVTHHHHISSLTSSSSRWWCHTGCLTALQWWWCLRSHSRRALTASSSFSSRSQPNNHRRNRPIRRLHRHHPAVIHPHNHNMHSPWWCRLTQCRQLPAQTLTLLLRCRRRRLPSSLPTPCHRHKRNKVDNSTVPAAKYNLDCTT